MTQQILTKISSLQHVLQQNELLNRPFFDELQQQLQSVSYNVTNQKFSIAVVAAMKAGKSTFLNALLGQDLLPNETDACTAAITEILHSNSIPRSYEKHLTSGRVEQKSFHSLEALYSGFHEDVRACRRSNDTSIEKYVVQAPIYALQNRDSSVNQFVLVDTPGPNEASSSSFNATGLRDITYRQLRIADVVVIVLDYTQLKSDINAQLINDLFSGNTYIENNPENVLFVLNKIDQQNSKDASIEQAISEAKAFIQHQSKGAIQAPKVYAVSALKGLLARMLLNEELQEQAMALVEERFGNHYAEKVEVNGKQFMALPEPNDLAKMLLRDSRIEEFEAEVLQTKFSNAQQQLLNNSQDKIAFAQSTIKNHIQTVKGLLTVEADALQLNLQQAEQSVAALQQDVDAMLKDFQLRATIFLNEMKLDLSNNNELMTKLTTLLDKYDDKIVAQQEDMVKKQLDLIYQEAFQVALNWQLRKKDHLIRKFNEFQLDNLKTQQNAFYDLSQKAATTIEQHVKFEMPTLRQFGEIQTLEYKQFDHAIQANNTKTQSNQSGVANPLNSIGDIIRVAVDVLAVKNGMPSSPSSSGLDKVLDVFTTVPKVDMQTTKSPKLNAVPEPFKDGGLKPTPSSMDPMIWIPIAEQVINLFSSMKTKPAAESSYYVSKFDIQQEIVNHYSTTMQQWQTDFAQFIEEYTMMSMQDLEQVAGKFIKSFIEYIQYVQQEVATLQANQQGTLQQIEQIETVLSI